MSALPCSMHNTNSCVYPAGPISNNLSLEEPNCFHYYSVTPVTSLFMNRIYWRVKTTHFPSSVAAFSPTCVITTKHNYNQWCRFLVMNGYGYRFSSCGLADSCHHGCISLLSCLYHGGIWKIHVWEMKIETVCLSEKLLSYWLFPLGLSTITVRFVFLTLIY